MRVLDNPWVRLINNWSHDVGTGLWAACLLVIWVLRTKVDAIAASSGGASAVSALADVQWTIFWLLVAALVVIAVTGVPRLMYWKQDMNPKTMQAARVALIGKHVAFLVIYGGGTWWAWTLIAR